MNNKQKAYLDHAFNKEAMSQMTLESFLKQYKGKMSMQVDINDAAKYLGVGTKLKKSSAQPEKK